MAMSSAILGPLLRTAVESVDFDDYYSGDTDEYDTARDAYQDAIYEAMADTIIEHIKNYMVVTTVVNTTGTAAAQTGVGVAATATAPTTGTIT